VPVIPATRETKGEGFKVSPGKVSETYLKRKMQKGWGMAQVAVCLSSNHEVLGSTSKKLIRYMYTHLT
jgi:hypothetical protein